MNITDAIDTYTPVEHVVRNWKVLKWKSMAGPQIVAKRANDGHAKLHKVLGATVEAIVRGVHHRFVRFPFSLISPLRSTTVY